VRYLSVCSGIEAATVAWQPLGWSAVGFSEIDTFPSAALAHHYPTVANFGDMTKFKEWPDATFDVLVGGTPCQSFSVAGLRKGLADPRGNLMLTYLAIADRYRPEWLVWENVPGVLSSNKGRDFAAFLLGLAELRYGFAFRILDAQYFGVPQRRRRVFVVANSRGWQRAAAVLFERASLRGDLAPSRESGKDVAGPIAGCSNGGGANGPGRTADDADSLIVTNAEGSDGFTLTQANLGKHINNQTPLIAFDPRQITSPDNRSQPLPGDPFPTLAASPDVPAIAFADVAISFKPSHFTRDKDGAPDDVFPPLSKEADRGDQEAVVFQPRIGRNGRGQPSDVVPALNGADAGDTSDMRPCLASAGAVRRLTPRECERLQGFPDDYTLVPFRGKPAADGPRYKALGNSMAVPVMRWIGNRIAEVA